MSGMLLAETRRWPRSGAWTVPLLGLTFGIVQFAIVFATGSATGWDGLIAGNVMWATSLAGPAAALLLVLVHVRERRARGGGAWWRPGSPTIAGVCRMLVCLVVVAFTNLLVLAPATVIGYLAAPSTFPAGRLLALAGALTLGAVVLYPVLDLLAARWGTAAPLILAVAWTLAGVLTAEDERWMMIPPAWPVRAVLPLLGTHANGIALAPDDPLAAENPAIAVLLTAVTLALLVVISLLAGRVLRSPRAHTKPAKRESQSAQAEDVQAATASFAPLPMGPVTRGRAPLLLGQPGSLRRTPLTWLVAAGLIAQLGVVLLWQSAGYAEGFAELVLLPVGAALLGVIGWTSTRDAWPAIATTRHRTGRIALARFVTLWLLLAATVLIASLLSLTTGADPGRTLRAGLLSVTVGWMLLVATFWLTARFTPGVAAAVNGIGLIVSLVLGAGELATALWPYAPWAWAHTPATAGWTTTAVIAVVSTLIGATLCAPAVSALRHRASEA